MPSRETSASAPAGAGIRWGVRSKLMLLAVTVATVPIAIVGASLLRVNESALEQANQELLAAIIDDISASVDRSFDDVETGLDRVSRALTDPDLADEVRLPVALATVSSSEGLQAVALYDQGGGLIDVIREQGSDLQFPATLAPEVRERADRRPPAIGRPEVHGDAPRVLIALPVRGAEARWFAATYASLALVQERVERIANARLGEGDNALFVVDDTLRAVAHSNPEVSATLASTAASPSLAGVTGESLATGIEIFGEFEATNRPAVIGAVRSLDRVPWAVVAEVPTAYAYASLARTRFIIMAVVLGAIAMSLLAAGWLSGRFTAPIRALVGYAGHLASRDFDRRVIVASRDELAVLGRAMNDAAGQLQASEDRLRAEAAIRGDLGRYLPAQLVERIVARDQEVALGGQRTEITVLFADVAAFTPLAESQKAEDVVAILNQLFTVLTEVVFRHNGTVDKFIGDCVMAFWGAPSPQADHAQRALAAAEDMLRWLEIANARWVREYGITVHLAIGVHTGDAIVGNFGSESRMEYTAVGDTVNVAARLESIARPQQILASEATKRAAGDGFDFIALGPQPLAGRMEPVELHEVRP